MQFSSVELFSQQRRSKLVPCWLAATTSEKSFKKHYKSSTIKKIDVAHTCEEIQKEIQLLRSDGKSERFIMYLSSQLMSGITRIHSYQVAYYQKEVLEIQIETEKALKKKKSNKEIPFQDGTDVPMDNLDYPVRELSLSDQNLLNAQLQADRHLLSDEDVNLPMTMQDVNFGHVNYKDMEFLFGHGDDISDEMRMLRINEEIDISEHINTLTIHEEIQEGHQSQEIRSPSIIDISKLKDKSKEGLSLTPQKRQQIAPQVETPSKRRRLSFETAATIVLPDPVEEVAVPTPEGELPIIQDHFVIKRRSKKGPIIDQKTILTDKLLQKWRQDVNIHCRQFVDIPSKYDKVKKRFLEVPSLLPMKLYLQWNTNLHNLFANHIVGPFISVDQDVSLFELAQSQEAIRVEETNSRLNLPIELSALVRTDTIVEPVDNTVNVLQITNVAQEIMEVPLPEVILDDTRISLGEGTSAIEAAQDQTESVREREDSPLALTSPDIWALLQVLWHDNYRVKFSQLIPKDGRYTKHDAAIAFDILVKFHAEKKLILEQPECFRTLWIRKYYNQK